jgi:hypothetical protein
MDTELATLGTSDNAHDGLDPPSTHEAPFDTTDTSLIPDNLPPMDRGRQAWMFCLCACVLEMLIWGYGFSFGVFQDWYTSNSPFNTASPIAVSAIGASALGVQYFEGVGLMALIQARPQWMRKIMWGCLGICSACLLLSSFATKVSTSMNSLMEGLAINCDTGDSFRNSGWNIILSSDILGFSIPFNGTDRSCTNGLMSGEVLLAGSSLEAAELGESSFRSWQIIFLKQWDINGLYGYGQRCL